MRDFLGEVELNIEQATNIARAMYKVAAVEDGVHEHEKTMIDSFYLACCEEAGVQPEDLSVGEWEAAKANTLLEPPALKETLVRSCLLVGYADGQCSDVERSLVRQMATDLGISDARVTEIEKEIRKALLAQFGGVKVFRDAAYDIGRQLGMSRDEVDEAIAL